VLSWIDRYGADSSSRKSALSALYLAAGRLISEPFMTTAPSVVHTHHRHVRPRFFKANSKTGNSRRCDRALRSAFKGAPENGKGHLPGWSVETHNWSMEMRSLFRVVKPGISSVLLGSAFFPLSGASARGLLVPPQQLPNQKAAGLSGAGRPATSLLSNARVEIMRNFNELGWPRKLSRTLHRSS
jgi:hypothetical protein